MSKNRPRAHTLASAMNRTTGLTALAIVTVCTQLIFAAPAAGKERVLAGSEIDYPPFCFVDEDGRADGFSVELMRAALGKMGRDVTFRTGPWKDVRGWLKRGEVDVLPLVGRTPEREALFDFTVPYLTMHGAIVVHKDTEGIHGLEDLRGHRVAVMEGDNAEEFLRREERGMEIITTPTFSDAFHKLAQGNCDAVVVQHLVALRLIKKTGLTNLQIIAQPVMDFKQDFCFAVRPADHQMLALLNEGLALAVADGTKQRLHAKWFASLQLPTDRALMVGGDHDYPPYEFINEKGRPDGFNVDIMRAVAREAGLDIKIQLGPWKDIVKALASGEIDLIQGMYYSPQRDRTFDFTQAHLVTQAVAVVRNDDGPAPTTPEELKNLRLAVEESDIMHDFAVKHGLEENLTLYESQGQALKALAAGRHDGALVGRIPALHWLAQNPEAELALGKTPLLTVEYACAVRNGRNALLAQLSEGLSTIKHTGEYRHIHEKWMGIYEPDPPALLVILKYSAVTVLPLLAITVLALLWSWGLRKKVAERTAELRENSEFQRALIACSPEAFFSLDNNGVVLSWNRSAQRMFGWSEEEVIGRPLPIVPEDKADEFAELRQEVLTSGGFTGKELVRRRKDCTLLSIMLSAAPINDRHGKKIGILGVAQDITQRIRNEQNIEHLNRVLRAIRDINQLIVRVTEEKELIQKACEIMVQYRGYEGAWIILVDETGQITDCAESKMDHQALNQIVARKDLPPCCRDVTPDNPLCIIDKQEKLCDECPLATGCKGKPLWCACLQHAEITFGYLGVRGGVITDVNEEEIELFVEVSGDLGYALHALATKEAQIEAEEEREAVQQQFMQAQKMESIGRLAGGVAHDFNNLLMGIINYTDFCRDEIAADHPIREWLDEIALAAQRSADLTRQLLAFARKQTIAPEILNLNETVEGMLKMLRRLIGENINLAWQPDSDLWPVELDPGQVDQILANLLINARDAINGVGKVTIETQNVTVDQDYCRTHIDAKPGLFVTLVVSDDGCGMDAETQHNIFEPFFTTKASHKGTGLGLATVHGIVRQNNGFINLYSEPGVGTAFRIYLPRSAEESLDMTANKEDARPEPGSETILLVEDDDNVRFTAQLFLERYGYTVLTAETPEQALTLADHHYGRIDLLITDVVMPGMNGRDLAVKMKEAFPQMKCLFISGYTANVIAHHGILDDGVKFLEKPFGRDKIRRKVRELLDDA